MSDEELERIKEKKLKELLKKVLREKEGKPSKPKVLKVNDSNFNSVVKEHSRLVIDFWAPWCAPCRMIEPIFHELAEAYAGKVAFGRLNVDENPATAAKFGVMSIPTLIMFKDGIEVDRIVGALPRRFIEYKIRKAFQL
ncbi:thioredoxin [Candidatus Bathyarchaeota archaeon]|nr:thioredoxin [Candidatus Bathyarchaeota archaeon]